MASKGNYYTESITIELFSLESHEVAEVVDELSKHFFEVIVRIRPAPPDASPIFGEFAVILLAISIAAQGFLQELGKDNYQALRKMLISIAKKAKRVRDNGGLYLGNPD